MKRHTKHSFLTIEQEIPKDSAVIHRGTILIGFFPIEEIRPKENKITEKTSVFAMMEI